jgi:hypothetical protein
MLLNLNTGKSANPVELSSQAAFLRLYNYCNRANYRGWDNFDGLNSTLFNKSPLYKSAMFRLIWIQAFKRSPVNLRKLTLVPKGYNAKGLALFVSGLVASGKDDEAAAIIEQLKKMSCSGYSGKGWGYNFDWQARKFLTPIGTPNTVTTVFVANALLDYYDKTKNSECLDLAKAGCQFFLENLVLFEDRKHLVVGYMPGANTRVHNVNMLAAALLARIFRLTAEPIFYEKSKKAMTYSINALQPDYSWPYGESSFQKFVDSFHTGFNLVALAEWMAYTGDKCWRQELSGAYAYYQRSFWLDDGCPKYYHNSIYPIDIHCSAQGIITFLKLSAHSEQKAAMAGKVAGWAIANMQDPAGYFYYQKGRVITNKIPYIRWSQAWMFYALSLLANHEAGSVSAK